MPAPREVRTVSAVTRAFSRFLANSGCSPAFVLSPHQPRSRRQRLAHQISYAGECRQEQERNDPLSGAIADLLLDRPNQALSLLGEAIKDVGPNLREFTPHTARHSWATWFYSQTKDLLRLKAEGGWESEEWERYVKLAIPSIGIEAKRLGFDFSEHDETQIAPIPSRGIAS